MQSISVACDRPLLLVKRQILAYLRFELFTKIMPVLVGSAEHPLQHRILRVNQFTPVCCGCEAIVNNAIRSVISIKMCCWCSWHESRLIGQSATGPVCFWCGWWLNLRQMLLLLKKKDSTSAAEPTDGYWLQKLNYLGTNLVAEHQILRGGQLRCFSGYKKSVEVH